MALISDSTKRVCMRAITIDGLDIATVATKVVRQHIGRKISVLMVR